MCGQYLHKGDKVAVLGDLDLQTYTDKNGVERTSLAVDVTDLEFCGGSKNGGANASSQAQTQQGDPEELPF